MSQEEYQYQPLEPAQPNRWRLSGSSFVGLGSIGLLAVAAFNSFATMAGTGALVAMDLGVDPNSSSDLPQQSWTFDDPKDLFEAAGKRHEDMCNNPRQYFCGGSLDNYALKDSEAVFTLGFNPIETNLKEQAVASMQTVSCAKALQSNDLWGAMLPCAYELCLANSGYHGVVSGHNLREFANAHIPVVSLGAQDLYQDKKELLTSSLIVLRKFDKYPLIKLKTATDLHRGSGKFVLRVGIGETFYDSVEKYDNPNDRENLLDYLLNLYKAQDDSFRLNRKISEDQNKIKAVLQFEQELIRLRVQGAAGRDPSRTHHPVPSQTVRRQLAEILDMDKIEQSYSGLAEYFSRGESFVDVYSENYLARLIKLVKGTGQETISDWIQLHSLAAFSPMAGVEFGAAYIKWKAVLEGNDETAPEAQCYDYILNHLQWPLSHTLIHRQNKQERDLKVSRAKTIVRDVKKWYYSAISEAWWMDDTTRHASLAKLDKLEYFVGWPEWMTDGRFDKFADLVYMQSTPDKKLTRNILSSWLSFQHSKTQAATSWADLQLTLNHSHQIWLDSRLGEEVNKSDFWGVYPHEANADYSPNTNSFCLPFGAMNTPLLYTNWESELSRLYSYGALGSIIAHEITHGFDDQGRKYDADGLLNRPVSSPAADERFQQVVDCIANEYSTFTVEGLNGKIWHIDGVKSQGENLADNGGVSVLVRAVMDGKLIPKDELTKVDPASGIMKGIIPLAAFYTIWCEKGTVSYYDAYVQENVHAPGMARNIGVAHNMIELNQVSQCPKGSLLNPEKRTIRRSDFQIDEMGHRPPCLVYYDKDQPRY